MAAHRSKRRRFAPSIALLAGVMSWMLLGVQTAQAAPMNVTANGLRLNMSWHLDVEATLCDNTGSYVSVNGNASLAQLGLRIRFRNQLQNSNAKTNYLEATADLHLDDTGAVDEFGNGWNNGSFYIRKQPAFGGVGGNPYISVDPDGAGGIDPVVLGRCVQGNKWGLNAQSSEIILGGATLQALTCDQKQSKLAINNDNSVGGVDATVMFDNNVNKVVHRQEAAAAWDLQLVDGWSSLKKGWGAGGFGGNPHIDGRFFTGPGAWGNWDNDPATPDTFKFSDEVITGGVSNRSYGSEVTPQRCKNMA